MSVNQQSIDQVIALAGIAQSIRIVQNVAWKGSNSEPDLKAMVSSLLRMDTDSAVAVYGGSFELSTGLRFLKQQLDTDNKDKDPEFIGLIINLFSIHKQLLSHSSLMEKLVQSIETLTETYKDESFYENDDTFQSLIKDCSEIYQQTLSKLPHRVQVKGEPKFLEVAENQVYVRAALLCAIRSVFLWRQSGGSRCHFIFKKKMILETTSYLISNPQK